MKVKVVTDLAIIRALSTFAQHLGLSEELAPAAAGAFLSTYEGFDNWNNWVLRECAGCSLSPDTCPFFHPSEVTHGTPQQVRNANITMVEQGQWSACPVRNAHQGS